MFTVNNLCCVYDFRVLLDAIAKKDYPARPSTSGRGETGNAAYQSGLRRQALKICSEGMALAKYATTSKVTMVTLCINK